MSHVLLPYVHGNQSNPELGPPRLRQVRLQEGKLGMAICLVNPVPSIATAAQLSELHLVI